MSDKKLIELSKDERANHKKALKEIIIKYEDGSQHIIKRGLLDLLYLYKCNEK